MAVEAELKALVRNPDRIHSALSRRAVGKYSTYSDRYFDYPDRAWNRCGNGAVRCSPSKNQPWIQPADRNPSMRRPSRMPKCWSCSPHWGVEQIVAFEKRCVNYRFTAQGRDLIATVVTVPELAGQTFIELETSLNQAMWTLL